ncbi:MAG TPA: ATP-binding cassette domain-containing protein, partial [Polyangiaceae bacterium]|nr:ATP-binding cassette domain-containing protein [Polyangiaceae bacterium]
FGFDAASTLLADLSFELTPGWTGVVGENGAGKSTLLGLLCGELAPGRGIVRVPPQARVHACPQVVDTADPRVLRLAESWDNHSCRIRARLELQPGDLARWPTLSPGERKRWQVAAALAEEPDVLLLDEPTNHLDAQARELLTDALRTFRGIGVLVAHDRGLLDALCNATLRVHAGSAVLYPGKFSDARATWEHARASQERARGEEKRRAAHAMRQLQEKKRAVASAEATRSARTRMKGPQDSDGRSVNGKARAANAEAKLSRQAAALRVQLERAQALLEKTPMEKAKGSSIHVRGAAARVRTLLHLEVAQLKAGSTLVARDVRCTVRRDSRIWLTGANGCGKSTLLKALAGARKGSRDSMLSLQQELDDAERDGLGSALRAAPETERAKWLTMAACLGLDPARVLCSPRLSPGEARKLSLSRALSSHAELLLLDEPVNHFDLPAIERLEQALTEFAGAIVLVSHDSVFAERLTRERWHFADQRLHVV